jgi:hypothetical protein
MKTPRERMMAYLALTLITVTAAGVLYFMYYDRNMSQLKNRQRTAESDIDTKDAALAEYEKTKPLVDLDKRLSLPETQNASLKYGEELEKMLALSGFPAEKIGSVRPKQSEGPKTTALGPGKQKPFFTRVLFDLTIHGDETMLEDFLDRFYRTPLLQRVKSITVARPVTKLPDQLPNELDINMTVEALILDVAEKRTGLLPEKLKDTEKPRRNARSSAQYAAIAGNNIFYGPSKAGPKTRDPKDTPDYNVTPEIVLDMIWKEDNQIWATLFDAADDYQYVIRKSYAGWRVDKYSFTSKDKRIKLEIGEETLSIKDANDYEHHNYKILRIDSADLYLDEGGKIFKLHVGYRLSDAKLMTRDETLKLGLIKE